MAGPPARTGTRLHRLEHGLFCLALLTGLAWIVFRLGWTDPWRVVFWGFAPDLVFLPIALTGRRGAWPPWGAALYNATHTYLVMLPTFALASFLQGHVVWPLLGWAIHLEADRALGFDLREWKKEKAP